MSRHVCVTVAALAGLFTATVHADGLIRDGIGAISVGRGGTNVAHFDNAAVLLDNPAGIVNVPARGLFEGGLDILITDMHYTDAQNSVGDHPNATVVPQGAFILRSPDERWAAGVGIFFPAGFGAEWDMTNPDFGQQTYRSLGILAKIVPGVAYKVTDRLSVGGTLGVGINHLELEGPLYLQTGALAGTPTLFDLNTTGASLIWSAGLQYQLGENTMLGLSYVSKSETTLDGQLDVQVAGLAPFPVFSRFDAQVEQTYPQSVAAGVTHLVAERHRLSADVIWFDWAQAFNDLDLKLTNPSNPLLRNALPPTVRDRVPLDWDDTISLRLGYEYLASNGHIWRTGYVYHPNPVPDSTLNPYTDGILQHGFSVGHSRAVLGWQLNTAYQYSFGDEEQSGSHAFVGGDFDNSTLEVDAHWITTSLLKKF